MTTLKIMLVEVKYCPICGRGLFGKKYIKETNDMFEQTYDGIWDFECKRCRFRFRIFTPESKEWKRLNNVEVQKLRKRS